MPKNYDTYRWAIVPVSTIDAADVTTHTEINGETRTEVSNVYIDSSIQTSKDTLRKSLDGTKAILKWDGNTPEAFEGMQTYTHPEILEMLAGSDWTISEEQP